MLPLKLLHAALCEVYDEDELDELLKRRFKTSLALVAEGGLSDKIFALLVDFDASGRLDELLVAAHEDRPTAAPLRELHRLHLPHLSLVEIDRSGPSDSLIDQTTFLRDQRDAQVLLEALLAVYAGKEDLEDVLGQIGWASYDIPWKNTMRHTWLAVVDKLASVGKLRALVEAVVVDPRAEGFREDLSSLL